VSDGEVFWLLDGFAWRRGPPPRLHHRGCGDWPVGRRLQLQQRDCSRFSRDSMPRRRLGNVT